MNLRGCEYLLAIAEEGTLLGASRQLGISQPTLSAFLAKTETELGKQLFSRTGRTLVANDAGRAYLDYCRRIVEIKQRTYHSISMLSPNEVETIRVAFTPHRGAATFSAVYWQFCQQRPNVKLEPHEGYMKEMRELVDTGKVDLVLATCTEQDRQDYTVFSQYKQELILSVPSSHPMAARALQAGAVILPADLREFRDVPFIMWGEGTTNRALLAPYFEKAGFTPTETYTSQNLLLIDTMLDSGAGAGFLPAYLCKPSPNRVYFSLEPPLYSTVCIYTRKDHVFTEAQRYFCYLVLCNAMLTAGDARGVPSINALSQELLDEFKEGPHGHTSA